MKKARESARHFWILCVGVFHFMFSFCVVIFCVIRPCTAQSFRNVSLQSGIQHIQHDGVIPQEHQYYMSGGVAAGDFDDDGWVDLYFTRLGQGDMLYRNLGNGEFADVTEEVFGPSHLVRQFTNGVAWADIDNDADLDLYVTALGATQHFLFVNTGTPESPSFSEQAIARNVHVSSLSPRFGFSPSFGDYDQDGYLDLYVTEWRSGDQNPRREPQNSRLLRNVGENNPGYFQDATYTAGVAMDSVVSHFPDVDSQTFTASFADLDSDNHIDLAIASDHGTSRLFWANEDDQTFEDGTEAASVGTDQFGMGSAIGDIDGDGDLDWFVTSVFQHDQPGRNGNRLYRNEGERQFCRRDRFGGRSRRRLGMGGVDVRLRLGRRS